MSGSVVSALVKRCHFCGNPASIFLTQITNGKLSDLPLCKKCAKERGIFDPRKLTLAEQLFPTELSGEVETFIKKMLDSSYLEEADDEEVATLPDMLSECPSCHYELETYHKTGQLGCPECYKTFAAELAILVEGVNIPAEARKSEMLPLDSPVLERSRLEVMMNEAITNENYEEAARLRDRLKKLSEST